MSFLVLSSDTTLYSRFLLAATADDLGEDLQTDRRYPPEARIGYLSRSAESPLAIGGSAHSTPVVYALHPA
mgnify:CR=1 FL=1